MNLQKIKAFTLVELIVVITILAILSTIWFVSYSWYLSWVRDSNRISQLKAISEWLHLYWTNHSLPSPDTTSTKIMDWATQIATQWYAWKNVLETITYSTEWVDPKDKTYFSYYLTRDKKYFQLMALLEEEDNLQNKATALDYSKRYPVVLWDKLWILTSIDNTPIQEIISNWSLDLSTTTLELKSFLKDSEYVKWSWPEMIVELEKLKDIDKVWWKFRIVENNQFVLNVPLVWFISVWDTRNYSWESNDDQIKLPLQSNWIYDFIVDWWDETTSHITVYNQIDVTHTYPIEWIYEVTITWEITWFSFLEEGQLYFSDWDTDKLIEIRNWGDLNLGNNWGYFLDCRELTAVTANDLLDLSWTTDLHRMFTRNEKLTKVNRIWEWDMSNVIDIEGMFLRAEGGFNSDISWWDLSSVTDISGIFLWTINFNWWDLSWWDISNISNIYSLFSDSINFSSNVNWWSFHPDSYVWYMFNNATNFNSDITWWDVSNLKNFQEFFYQASDFNQDISWWDISSATNMNKLFRSATLFNQDLSWWGAIWDNVTSCTDFDTNATAWSAGKPTFTNCTY